ncbi:primosomal protein N' [Thermosipho sp. 1063]|uniref:replication restart helicase PriA n=1 Tax=unclassified Thermosipho (in: thermotogales) TaxID=2676525 RepID=UPI0009493EA9|nr:MULTISPECIES: primosomal protein N' [unclassified Thermosipho (in: thermotogales)]ANQ53386.1 primosomal protein N' [Thermosipho sp. 1070]APT71835.1 primosomal protein N' [Thermosipho sp. 1063]OOC44972.1 primosomal protein N' [Thermosipho sp. 1074]
MIYEVAISNSSFKRTFFVNSDFKLETGERIFLKFRGRKEIGYVLKENPGKVEGEVIGKVDGRSFLEGWFVEALNEASNFFNTPIGRLFDLSFPKGIENYFVEKVFSNNPLYDFNGMAVGEFIERFGEKKLKEFLMNGVIYIEKDFQYKFPRPRKELYVFLNALPSEIFEKKLTKKQKKVIDYLLVNNYTTYSELREFLDINKDVLLQLERKGLLRLNEEFPKDFEDIDLSESQKKIVEDILKKNKLKVLLYGVTGSGKTEVYLSVIKKSNSKTLYLVPEVSLIEQTVNRIKSRLSGKKVGIFHSYLTKSQKIELWMRAVTGKIDILVGTRSAFFIPFNKDLIIVDEEHDDSYYQDGEVVYDLIYLVEKFPGLVIFGSATPRLEHYVKATRNDMKLCTLKERYGTVLPKVEVVDMKEEEKVIPYVSKSILKNVKRELENGKSVMFFVRRKGYSLIMCQNCGNVLKCPNCDVALTYHKSERKLKCHICGFESVPEISCQICGSVLFYEKGMGTERLEGELQKVFPGRNIVRVDTEVVKNYQKFQKVLKKLYEGEIDILIGTKMITKGLDVPTVSLIGVIDVDAMRNIPDYNSSLNLFRLLVQVIGRAGRKEKGKALIQTYERDSFVIEYALRQDVEGYYEYELKQRKDLEYPPFVDIIQVIVYSNNKELGLKNAKKLVLELENFNLKILGPTEFFIPKIRNNFLYHFIVKTHDVGKTNRILNEVISKYPTKVKIRVNPPSLYVT